ncbi:MAG TPA: hopanoid biosynthesis associated glycosyl transferase HpnI, partial [Beijerinckiaceae bacterium]|nr:hopanoid biosynthesis associated glycosyl transferase HpnI [Beijerinckiaceae bacterium]
MTALRFALLALVAGSVVYQLLAIVATFRYRAVRILPLARRPRISILKPLCGHEPGMDILLASHFEQDYPDFELLFGVHTLDDPAVAVVEALRHR